MRSGAAQRIFTCQYIASSVSRSLFVGLMLVDCALRSRVIMHGASRFWLPIVRWCHDLLDTVSELYAKGVVQRRNGAWLILVGLLVLCSCCYFAIVLHHGDAMVRLCTTRTQLPSERIYGGPVQHKSSFSQRQV